MERFVRKIRRVGTHSYAVTLPKRVIKRFGWRERQKLVLLVPTRKRAITIKDWQPKSK